MNQHFVEKPKEKAPAEFADPFTTAKGKERASVDLIKLNTLWINTGTLCNIECVNCYIESSPKNDSLAYITLPDVIKYLDEIRDNNLGTHEIGFTGGEPFMNKDIIPMVAECLRRGFKVIVLTNAMKPMQHKQAGLLSLSKRYGGQLTIRVSVDHYTQEFHEEERGKHTWEPMLKGLKWLSDKGFNLDAAGRTRWGEDENKLRTGYAKLFKEHGIKINARDSKKLVLFPEMDPNASTPEITDACWGILDVDPNAMMCATSRMVVKRKGAETPEVMPCTLLFEDGFGLGKTLADSDQPVPLNSPKCSKFCALGGGSCSQ